MSAWRRAEEGTSAIEFALVLPFMMLLLLGVIEMGRYTYYAILCAHAARAGVQYGAQNVYTADNQSGMDAAAIADAPNAGFTATSTPVCVQNGAAVTCLSSGQPAGTIYYVQVVVSGTFTSLFHYPGIPGSVKLSSTATMRVAAQ